MFRRFFPWLMATLLIVLIFGVPLAFTAHRQITVRNFRVVENGVLYRSGQITAPALKRIVDEYGIRSIISLRNPERKDGPLPPDHAEELWALSQGMNYYRIKPRRWGLDEELGSIPAQQGVDEFLKIMDDPKNHPVLIHCFAGIHRTGAHCAVFRLEYHGWSNHEALDELRLLGYRNLDKEEDVSDYLEEYVPRKKR